MVLKRGTENVLKCRGASGGGFTERQGAWGPCHTQDVGRKGDELWNLVITCLMLLRNRKTLSSVHVSSVKVTAHLVLLT